MCSLVGARVFPAGVSKGAALADEHYRAKPLEASLLESVLTLLAQKVDVSQPEAQSLGLLKPSRLEAGSSSQPGGLRLGSRRLRASGEERLCRNKAPKFKVTHHYIFSGHKSDAYISIHLIHTEFVISGHEGSEQQEAAGEVSAPSKPQSLSSQAAEAGRIDRLATQ